MQPTYDPQAICVDSPVFVATVWDVCSVNMIQANTISQSLQAPILQTDAITLTNFPWPSTYGDTCGFQTYEVLYQGAPVPDEWVYYINGELHIEPINVPVGDYIFTLQATNNLYTNITNSRPFNVRVTPC